ncbi:hypothetical protein [Spirosoma sordidisoli]|uniref:Uncharacterized protein n=1 Tax=Spirosoma sordidisoli TaxID=2502893 RepID=A0A4Q2UIJ8_9BACT|nr:hypothetical protein [Spirosoma sordidisoli]RYC68946.1 hypothetical protein EQG79_16205 [Spirosoma sordidisoli]
MALTTIQLKTLRYDLQELAHIDYHDVLTELLDHYATLTEQKMETGLSFEEASRWAWAELGSGKGLQAIQADFVRNIRQQIRRQHMGVLKSYFRWPTIVLTALVGVLVYLVVPMLSDRTLTIGLVGVTLVPLAALLRGYWYGDHHRENVDKIVWKYVYRVGVLPVNVFQIMVNANFFSDSPASARVFLQTHTSVVTMLSLLLLIYAASFIQLYQQKYVYKHV